MSVQLQMESFFVASDVCNPKICLYKKTSSPWFDYGCCVAKRKKTRGCSNDAIGMQDWSRIDGLGSLNNIKIINFFQ